MKKTAFISVNNSEGIKKFANKLIKKYNFTIISFGSTARLFQKENISFDPIDKYVSNSNIIEKQIQYFDFKIIQSIIDKNNKLNNFFINLIVINFFDFSKNIQSINSSCNLINIHKNNFAITSLLRNAAISYKNITSLCHPDDYKVYLDALAKNPNKPSEFQKKCWAIKAIEHIRNYDKLLSVSLLKKDTEEAPINAIAGFPDSLSINFQLYSRLPYGDNQYQEAALYGDFLQFFQIKQGKSLNYQDILEVTSAVYLISEFEKATIAILKDNNPFYVSSYHNSLIQSLKYVPIKLTPNTLCVVNRTVDQDFAKALILNAYKTIIAPFFTSEACVILAKKKNLRRIVANNFTKSNTLQEIRSIPYGLLVQDHHNYYHLKYDACKVLTKRKPTSSEWTSLMFAWRILKNTTYRGYVHVCNETTLMIRPSINDELENLIWESMILNNNIVNSYQETCIALNTYLSIKKITTFNKIGIKAIILSGHTICNQMIQQEANKQDITIVSTNEKLHKNL